MLGNVTLLFRLIFTKLDVFKINQVGTPSVSGSLDLDQDQRIIGSGIGPNCLQMLSAGGYSIKAFGTYCKFEQ